jgi:hypothetical protein
MTSPSLNGRAFVRVGLAGLVAALAVQALVGAVATPFAAATSFTGITFDAELHGCVDGTTPQKNTHEQVTWRDRQGTVKARFSIRSDGVAHWQAPSSVCDANRVAAGDTFIGQVTKPTILSHRFRVQSISGTFDRTTNLLQGTARGPGTFTVYVYNALPSGSTNFPCHRSPHRNPAGHFRWKTTDCDGLGYDADGGDGADVSLVNGQGDETQAIISAQMANVTIGSSKISGYALPGASIDITLRSAGGSIKGSGHTLAHADGTFVLNLRKGSKAPVAVAAGDRLAGNWAGSVHLRVASLNAGVTATAIHGKCMPNAPFDLSLWLSNGSTFGAGGTTNASGSTGAQDFSWTGYTADLSRPVSFTCQSRLGDRITRVQALH